ncbi:MAG: hypothetical protein P4L46_17540 [Fimbriimonas sp.]|nr:hypothetical protein [Fimbriimonas sp.]
MNTITYVGKVFEAGEYPDKGFAISSEELADRVRAFAGVDLDLEHSPFRDLLGHRLGRLERIWLDGRNAMGRLAIPRWLHELCGGHLQTSLTFDHAKNIVGCALTLSPRIRDAEVAAAFSIAQAEPPASPPNQETEPMHQTLTDRLRVLFKKAPDAVTEAGIDPAELDAAFAVPTPARPEAQIDPSIAAQLSEFRTTNERLVTAHVATAAERFADETIRASKAVPAQRASLAALFKAAAIADGQGRIRFSEDGQIAEGSNLAALRELFKDAVPHSLFTTQIPNADPNADTDAPDASMVERLRQSTHLGRLTHKEVR